MPQSYNRVDRESVRYVFKMRDRGHKLQEIADSLGRAVSTISNLLNCYKHPVEAVWDSMSCNERSTYVWKILQSNRRSKRKKSRKLANEKLCSYVLDKLIDEHWSPEAIAARAKDETGLSISSKSIYNYIKRRPAQLKECLIEKGRSRRSRVTHRRGRFLGKEACPEKVFISARPEVINNRRELGHWEGDLITSCIGASTVLLTLRDRCSRAAHVVRLPNKESHNVLGALRALIASNPPGTFKSFTFDNGGEFTPRLMHQLKKLNISIYYCQAYKSQQKGSVENLNKLLRFFFPKGTDFGTVGKEYIRNVQDKINNRPVKLLGFKTPKEFIESVKLAA